MPMFRWRAKRMSDGTRYMQCRTYTVREKAGNDTNIDYDTMNAEVKVKVTKDAARFIWDAKTKAFD